MTFERVVCGFDGSDNSLGSLQQAGRLLAAGGRLTVVVVVELGLAVHAGHEARRISDELLEEGRAAAARATEARADSEVRLVEGRVAPTLLRVAEEVDADLLAVGIRGHSRAVGIVLGSVATTAVHDASCSVFVARPGADVEQFPQSIVVGIDGSEQSARAAEIASALSDRLGSQLRLVAAEGGKGVDRDAVERIAPDAEVMPGRPIDVLLAAAEDAELVLVGHRGLHGVGALGSVSERIAHRATCSVLVVR